MTEAIFEQSRYSNTRPLLVWEKDSDADSALLEFPHNIRLFLTLRER